MSKAGFIVDCGPPEEELRACAGAPSRRLRIHRRPLVVSTFLTTLLLPTAATLAEDSFAAVGRGVVGVWSWVRPWRRRASEV